MLTQSVMIVVFTLKEKITLGRFILTAPRKPKSYDMVLLGIKVP